MRIQVLKRDVDGYRTRLQGPAALAAVTKRFSSALCHTGRPLLRCSVCFPGDAALLFKAEESRGLMCQHPGFPRGGVTLTLFQKNLMFA